MDRETALITIKKEVPYVKIDCVPNQLIALQGDQKGLVYYLEKGWTKLSKISLDGKENCFDYCAPGELSGLATLFSSQEFPVNITAITHCKLLAFKKSSLEPFLLKHPHIMAVIFSDIGEKIVKLRESKIAATQQDSHKRVRDLLTHFANIFGINSPSGRLIPFIITQQEIADFLGLSRPWVSTCLKGLLELGLIQRQGQFFLLPSAPPKTAFKVKNKCVRLVQ